MSAQDNLSPVQFKTLYRGLTDTTPRGIKRENLGIHWTDNKSRATDIALGVHVTDANPNDIDPPSHGVVLEARVHVEHLVQRSSQEGKALKKKHEIFSYGKENEVTVRPGAPVTVHKVEHITYNPSRGFRTRSIQKKMSGNA